MAYYNRSIFLIGGHDTDYVPLDSVDLFSMTRNSCAVAPKLSQARFSHSSCMLGHLLYAFGGYSNNQYLSSMEVLDAESVIMGKEGVKWQPILLNQAESISPRWNAVMAPIG